jgi:phenylacetate-CoA ligase
VLLSLGNTAPYYKLIVDRVNNTDMLEIQVELSQEMFSDTIKSLEEGEKRIKNAIDSTLGISAKITLVEPKSIERVEGKAVRVIDKRKLH